MGKIKKHKHFGDRNPLKQREEREQKLVREKKINNPPKEEQEQEVSKRFKKFVQMKQQSESVISKSKKKNKNKLGKRVTVHDDFDNHDNLGKKMTNESNKQHLRRVDEVLAKKKTEAEYAKKFGVQIIRDIDGQIKMRKDPLISSKSKKKSHKKDPVEEKKAPEEEPAISFPIIKYNMSAKMKRKLEQEETQVKQDVVKFGEVALEPPTFHLSQKPNQKVTKPGKRDYLFLTKLNMK